MSHVRERFRSVLARPTCTLAKTMKKQGGWVECIGCEEYFWVPGITEEKAKQLSKQVVLCPACRKRAEEDTKEDQ